MNAAAPLLLVAALAAPAPARLVPDTLLVDEQSWYGLYMHGDKVGWMQLSASGEGAELVYRTRMQARVRGMDQVVELEMHEERRFDRASQALTGLRFSQGGRGVSTTISATCRDGTLEGTVTTGGRRQLLAGAPCAETLADQLAAELLARDQTPGSTRTSRRYEPSMLATLTVRLTLTRVERTLADGVPTRLVHVASETIDPPGTGIRTAAVLDAAGTLLSSEIGGFFVARLEPEEQARAVTPGRDLLASAVVALPATVAPSVVLAPHEISFAGFPEDFELLERDFQRAARRGAEVRFTIRAPRPPDPAPGRPIIPPPEVLQYLRAEPQYQSDDPALRVQAERIVAGAADAWAATRALARWVDQHLTKAYLPALANALDVLREARGDCTEHSTLFVALARAAQIPARQVVGIAYWPEGGGYGWHSWAEVWLGRWVPVDPTWGQELADTSHIALASGAIADQARIAGLLGRIRISALRPLAGR